MADFTYPPGGGGVYADARYDDVGDAPNRLNAFTNLVGALVSLSLIAGIGIWGYQLMMRDVSGIPVVRAAEGEMRVRPDDPGGELARHQGLSVNTVPAHGVAAAPADELRLAPVPVTPTEDDLAVSPFDVAALPQPAAPIRAPEPLDLDLDNLAPVPSASPSEPSFEVVSAAANAAVASVLAEEPQSAVLIDAPGVRQSLRPRKRPAERATLVPASLSAETGASGEEVDVTALPAGTGLAQLGAFDSVDAARAQWSALETRFEVYMTDKKRVIQQASSGGRVFYRLRAHGFEEIADARRFCAALVAENADCIPVVVR
jgi:hypothetical protein